ncbi:hypothetical protein [Roseivirga sp. E12]|uniref:hypothetical protein n=1 Tax=Roseivirga sp. E12 TaxID=2819237 RepID=UPI001ABC9DDB|nr:hypothetical protein [Roseivirga sp. E12]MBO3700630.1 hypothetical protein [Roseivirga sp. E12]
MKFLTAKTISLTLLLIIMTSACSDETSPEDVVDIISEKSIIHLNGRDMEKSVSYQITYREGEVISKEIISVTIDGQSLKKSTEGNWTTDISVRDNENIPNPVRSELPGLAGEDCETEVNCQNLSKYGPGRVILPLRYSVLTETTCTSAGYEDGVLVITITYSSNVSIFDGRCP